MLLSTGDVGRNYQVIQLVIGFASGDNGQAAYKQAVDRLIDAAKAHQADAVMHIAFQNRVAVASGCGGPKQVLEVFASGTAIRLI